MTAKYLGSPDGFDPDNPGAMEMVGGPMDGAVLVYGTPVACDPPWVAIGAGADGADKLVCYLVPATIDGRPVGYGLAMLDLVDGEDKVYQRRVHVPGLGWINEEAT